MDLTANDADTEPSEFVTQQLRLCECLHLAFLFQGYDEARFRSQTLADLERLELDTGVKEKVMKRIWRLQEEANCDRGIAALIVASSSTSSTPIEIICLGDDDDDDPMTMNGDSDNGHIRVANSIFEDVDISHHLSDDHVSSDTGTSKAVLNNNVDENSRILVESGDGSSSPFSTHPMDEHGDRDSGLPLSNDNEQEERIPGTSSSFAVWVPVPVADSIIEDMHISPSMNDNYVSFEDGTSNAVLNVEENENSNSLVESGDNTPSTFIMDQHQHDSSSESNWGSDDDGSSLRRLRNDDEDTDELPLKIRNQFWVWDETHETTKPLKAFQKMKELVLDASALDVEWDVNKIKRHLSAGNRRQVQVEKGQKKVTLSAVLHIILSEATWLHKISFTFTQSKDVAVLLKLMKKVKKRRTCLKELHIKANRNSKDAYITEKQLKQLSTLHYCRSVQSLQLDCGIQICDTGSLEISLEKLTETLTSLRISGGIVSTSTSNYAKKPFIINLRDMKKLSSLDIASNYTISIPDNTSEPSAMVDLTASTPDPAEEALKSPCPVLLDFGCNPHPNLTKMRLGPLCTVKLNMVNFPNLAEFFVGGPWNLANVFADYQHSADCTLKKVQFPDALRDPSFIAEVSGLYFHNLTKVILNLPTVSCLQKFLNCMAGSKLNDLRLCVNYDFEAGLFCPLLGLPYKLSSEHDMQKLAQLKLRRDWSSFARACKIDLPGDCFEMENEVNLPLGDGSSVVFHGIASLQSLRVLALKKLCRKLSFQLQSDSQLPSSSLPANSTRMPLQELPNSRFLIGQDVIQELLKLKQLRLLVKSGILFKKDDWDKFRKKMKWPEERKPMGGSNLVATVVPEPDYSYNVSSVVIHCRANAIKDEVIDG